MACQQDVAWNAEDVAWNAEDVGAPKPYTKANGITSLVSIMFLGWNISK